MKNTCGCLTYMICQVQLKLLWVIELKFTKQALHSLHTVIVNKLVPLQVLLQIAGPEELWLANIAYVIVVVVEVLFWLVGLQFVQALERGTKFTEVTSVVLAALRFCGEICGVVLPRWMCFHVGQQVSLLSECLLAIIVGTDKGSLTRLNIKIRLKFVGLVLHEVWCGF